MAINTFIRVYRYRRENLRRTYVWWISLEQELQDVRTPIHKRMGIEQDHVW